MTVLVMGAQSAKALIITRNLGKRGIPVVTSGHRPDCPAYFSKYSVNNFTYPNPKESEDLFIKFVKNKIKNKSYDLIIPSHSDETLVLSKFKSEIEPYLELPLVNYEKFKRANNKKIVLSLAKNLGIKIPNTVFISDLNELETLDISYPVVLKLEDESGNLGMEYADSKSACKSKLEKMILKYNLKPSNFPLIQQKIEGYGAGTSLLFDKGEVKAIFSHLRIRQNPKEGGPSTLRIGIKNNKMETAAIRLMKNFDWHGVVMVEFILEKNTLKPYLIEVNPRFWGSLNQAIASGVEFPYLLYLVASGKNFEPVVDYNVGVRTRFLPLDILALPSYLKNSRDKINVLINFLKNNGAKMDIEDFNDFRSSVIFYFDSLRGR